MLAHHLNLPRWHFPIGTILLGFVHQLAYRPRTALPSLLGALADTER